MAEYDFNELEARASRAEFDIYQLREQLNRINGELGVRVTQDDYYFDINNLRDELEGLKRTFVTSLVEEIAIRFKEHFGINTYPEDDEEFFRELAALYS